MCSRFYRRSTKHCEGLKFCKQICLTIFHYLSLKMFRKVAIHPNLFYGTRSSSNTAANQIAVVMKKLSKNKKGKSKWYGETIPNRAMFPLKDLLGEHSQRCGKQGIRRANMLNKLFMRNITDVMVSCFLKVTNRILKL